MIYPVVEKNLNTKINNNKEKSVNLPKIFS